MHVLGVHFFSLICVCDQLALCFMPSNSLDNVALSSAVRDGRKEHGCNTHGADTRHTRDTHGTDTWGRERGHTKCPPLRACAIYGEHQSFDRAWGEVRKDIAKFITPLAIHAFPFRFRDNLVGAAVGHVPIEALQALYSKPYDLQLQEEGCAELTTLESHPQIDARTGRVTVAPKNKRTQHSGDQSRALIRYRDWYAPNARAVLCSLIPGLVQNCLHWASTHVQTSQNIQHTLQEMRKKGYPGRWWKPAFNRTLRRHGAPRTLIQETHQSPFCRTAPDV